MAIVWSESACFGMQAKSMASIVDLLNQFSFFFPFFVSVFLSPFPAQHKQSAAGSLVFEEDTTGDAMYVVLSGECAICARPAHAASIPQQQSQPVSTVSLQPTLTAGAHESGSDTDEEEEPGSAILPPRVARSEAEHSSSFWIHKYMQQVVLSYSRARPGLVVWFSAAHPMARGICRQPGLTPSRKLPCVPRCCI